MTPLGLHPLSALDVGAADLIGLAAWAGCQEVSLFVEAIHPDSSYPLVSDDNIATVRQQLQQHAIRVANIESFLLTPGVDITVFRPAFERGAELGARSATVLLYDTDPSRVVDNLGRLCELANQQALRVGIEFLALTPAWNTLEQVVQLATQVAQPNLGLGIDLLHLVRSGGSIATVASLPPDLIHYAQLCDGADLRITQDYPHEASRQRLAPGEGQFPVQSFIKALPVHTALEIEVPQISERPAQQRIDQLVNATRRQLQLAGRQ